jgi:hypothetical protein
VPARQREKPPLPPVSKGRISPGVEACAAALETLDWGEAPRIGLLGDTGGGKTRAAQEIALTYLKRAPGLVVVVDAKGERRFDDLPVKPPPEVRLSPADYAARPTQPGSRVVIFRTGMMGEVSPEEIAHFTAALAERRWGSLTINDELDQAARGGQWKKGAVFLPRSFIRGRTQGIAQVWGTTSPHNVPLEAFDQSSEIWCFKMAGMGLRLLGEREYLNGIEPRTIEQLAGYPLPPEERGQFVRLQRGRAWDGRVYKFSSEGRPAAGSRAGTATSGDRSRSRSSLSRG